ncbi:hypothetical protein GFL58_06790 [Rhizobium leguminosarum bv. viciae]|nr:hypothetical protein [Rhizobium leguminosarum bv. viciae]
MEGYSMAKRAISSSNKSGRSQGRDQAAIAKDLGDESYPQNTPEGKGVATDLDNTDVVTIEGKTYLTRRKTHVDRRVLDILPDIPDLRDRIYQPHLRVLHHAIYPTIGFPVRTQGEESSCVGHALAHVIDMLRHSAISEMPYERASAAMLYNMAKRNDEWADSPHDGSSLRGALRGFYRNGVCEDDHPDPKKEWVLTYERANKAKETRLGAYYRLQPDVSDYHAALNEVGAIYASAQIHQGWLKPEAGKIAKNGAPIGGHAFVIVGYNAEGFWILNSWGDEWGDDGIAHWAYDDWAGTIMDAWVLQLGVRAPASFGILPGASPSSRSGLFGFGEPIRSDILGHFVNIDDGQLVETGKYASPKKSEMFETVKRLTMKESNNGKGYPHLVIYAHGGLNSTVAEATRIASWKRADIFGRNMIYNFHLMWASGFLDEALGPMSKANAGLAGSGYSDWIFETGIGKYFGNRAWRNMKGDAEAAFSGRLDYDGGFRGLENLLRGIDEAPIRPKLHLVGHSAGSIVLGRLLSSFERFGLKNVDIESIHLMAPACTIEFFEEHYGPLLNGSSKVKLVQDVNIYMMTDELEQEDTVESGLPLTPKYSHSLLYLVSRAYEERPKTPLAGMEIYSGALKEFSKLHLNKSVSGATRSTAHGGFDNDAATLTTIMSKIVGGKLMLPPRPDELQGY